MKRITKIATLMLALFVLALPLGALADDLAAEFALSNIVIKTEGLEDNLDTTIDAGIDVKLLTDETQSFADIVFEALAGEETALKGGVSYDAAAKTVVMALEGATDALSMSIDEAAEQAPVALPFDQDALMAALAPLQGLTLSDETTEKISAAVMGWVAAFVPQEPAGQEDVEFTEMITGEELGTLTMDRYDFSLTVGDIAALAQSVVDALKGDEVFLTTLQGVFDEVLPMVGEEKIDLSQTDLSLPEDVASLPVEGSLYMTEEGNISLTITVGDLFAGTIDNLMLDDGTQLTQTMVSSANDIASVSTCYIHSTEPFNMEYTQIVAPASEEGVSKTESLYLAVDMTDGISFAVNAGEDTTVGEGDEAVSANQNFYLIYAGQPVQADASSALIGTLNAGFKMGELGLDVTCDVLVAVGEDIDVSFDMPINVIDVTAADEETQAAIGQEYMTILQNGMMKLMTAPGVAEIMSILSGNAGSPDAAA